MPFFTHEFLPIPEINLLLLQGDWCHIFANAIQDLPETCLQKKVPGPCFECWPPRIRPQERKPTDSNARPARCGGIWKNGYTIFLFMVDSEDARLVHDCPLLELSGVGLETLSLDIMHSWHLGPLQLLTSMALNYAIDSNLWAPPTEGLDAADKRKLSLLAIKAEQFQWYKEKRKDPDWRGKGSEAT